MKDGVFVLPQLASDEDVTSWWGAVNALSAAPSRKFFLRSLGEAGKKGFGLLQQIQTAARLLEVPEDWVITNHTTIGFFHWIPKGTESRRRDSLGLRVWSHARFCNECVAEQVASRGRSYWQRLHQLPGVFMCLKHRTALREVEIQRSKGDSAPFLPPDRFRSADWCFQPAAIPTVPPFYYRYLEITEVVLNEVNPLPARLINTILLEAFRRKYPGTLRDGMADMDRQLKALPFLLSPKRGTQKNARSSVPILGEALISRETVFSTQAYLIRAALLFSSAEEFMSSIRAKTKSGFSPLAKTVRADVSFERISAAYVVHGGRLQGIAQEVGLHQVFIGKKCREYGLPSPRAPGFFEL